MSGVNSEAPYRRTMDPEQFDPGAFDRNMAHRLMLAAGTQQIPVLLVRGAASGKTLVVTAGVHGDEFEGVRAILEVADVLDPSQMHGDLLAIPVAHPAAFWSAERTSPLDGLNLARVFPGNCTGEPTEKVAAVLAERVIARADFYLDLHSGGTAYAMPMMAGYDASDPRSSAAARIFGAETIWGHGSIPPGRTISFAKSRDIPWIYTEARGACRIDSGDLKTMKQGVLNLMRHLGILMGRPTLRPIRLQLYGDGDTDCGICAGREGFLLNHAQLLEEIRENQMLGVLVNSLGELLEEYRAPRSGTVALIHEHPVVKPGDSLYLIADCVR